MIIHAARLAIVVVTATAVFAGDLRKAFVVAAIFVVCLEWTLAATRDIVGTAAVVSAALMALLVAAVGAGLAPRFELELVALVETAVLISVFVAFVERLVRSRVELPHVTGEGAEAEIFDRVLGRVPPRALPSEWPEQNLQAEERKSTRVFDVVVALLGLVATAPLWPLLALLAWTRPGGPFFRQLRMGENGRVYAMLKFRTMPVGAEPDGALWAQADDPRVSWRGRILRETHLDELPQLLNVLRGDMSIVGPRPERPEMEALLDKEIPHWSRRRMVKPGITGWAQVRQGYAGDCDASEQKLSYDLWYLRHRSLRLDLAICVETLPKLLSR